MNRQASLSRVKSRAKPWDMVVILAPAKPAVGGLA